MSLKRAAIDDDYEPAAVVAKKPRSKPGSSLKALEAKLKVATEDEAKGLLKSLLGSHPEIMQEVLKDFQNKEPHPILRKLPPLPPPPQPRLMPVKPAADDELLRTCFHCGGEGSGEGEDGGLTRLHSSSEIKICSYCNSCLFGKHDGTFTRDKVQEYFHFTKAEADAIPRKTATGGFYKSKIYIYSLESVVRAVKKKHGSLYLMAKNSNVHR